MGGSRRKYPMPDGEGGACLREEMPDPAQSVSRFHWPSALRTTFRLGRVKTNAENSNCLFQRERSATSACKDSIRAKGSIPNRGSSPTTTFSISNPGPPSSFKRTLPRRTGRPNSSERAAAIPRCQKFNGTTRETAKLRRITPPAVQRIFRTQRALVIESFLRWVQASRPALFMKVPHNALVQPLQAVSAAVSLFSSPGLQAGVRSDFYLEAALPAFLFSASSLATPMAEATFRKPAEAGWEKSGGFADPGVNAWAREKSHSFMNNPGPGLSSAKSKACTVIGKPAPSQVEGNACPTLPDEV